MKAICIKTSVVALLIAMTQPVHSNTTDVRAMVAFEIERHGPAGLMTGKATERLVQSWVVEMNLRTNGKLSHLNPLESNMDGRLQKNKYQIYRGEGDCKAQARAKVESHVDGIYDDWMGAVEYTEVKKGRETLLDPGLCHAFTLVKDVTTGRIWGSVNFGLTSVYAISTRASRGSQTQRSEGRLTLKWHEGTEWIAKRLLHMNEEGKDGANIPLANGYANVGIKWKLNFL